jgi:ketosteroid isomerase-like protein
MDFEIQIKDREAALLEAIRTGDVNALDELLHENLLFNLPDGQTKNKAFDMETYRSGKMAVESISSREMDISRIDGETAVVAVTIDLKATWYDTPVDGAFRYLRVWKSSGRKWQVIAGSVVPVMEVS